MLVNPSSGMQSLPTTCRHLGSGNSAPPLRFIPFLPGTWQAKVP